MDMMKLKVLRRFGERMFILIFLPMLDVNSYL